MVAQPRPPPRQPSVEGEPVQQEALQKVEATLGAALSRKRARQTVEVLQEVVAMGAPPVVAMGVAPAEEADQKVKPQVYEAKAQV